MIWRLFIWPTLAAKSMEMSDAPKMQIADFRASGISYISDQMLLEVKHCSKKNLSGKPKECQTVWVQIGLEWVEKVYKCYMQATKVVGGKVKKVQTVTRI